MSLRIKYLILLLAVFSTVKSQDEEKIFVEKFYASDIKQRIKSTALLSPEMLKHIYPHIKDTLEKIKKIVYFRSENNQGRFLCDMIEGKLSAADQNYSKAIFILKTALQNHATNVNDSLLCLTHLKNYYIKTTNYIRAFEANAKIEQLWNRRTESENIDFGARKSSLYALLNFMPEAIKERRIEFTKDYNVKDTNALAGFYNDLGVYFNRMKNSDSAEHYFSKAQFVLSTVNVSKEKQLYYDFFKALIGGNLGLSYYNKGDAKRAMPLLIQDIYFSKKHKDYMSAFNSHNLMVECLLKQNDKAIAKKHLDTAEVILNEYMGDLAQKIKFLLIKSKFYQAVGDDKKSNVYLNKYLNLKDSLANIEKEQNLMNTEIAFKMEQKETELFEKTRIIDQKKLLEAKHKTYNAYLLTGFILLLGVIILLILRNQYSKKREKELFAKNQQIEIQNAQIEQSLKEKEILIKEIHHRVKNNLQIITSMLSLQISKEEGSESENILRDAKQRMGSIALTHQMLYQNGSLVNIPVNDYIENLVKQIEESLPKNNIELIIELEATDKKVNIDNAVPLGLLINELLTNSFKHAFPNKEKGVIKVFTRKNGEGIILGITDNGIGLPNSFDKSKTKSMGMDLINILAEQLNAKLTVDSKNGTTFTLEILGSKLFV